MTYKLARRLQVPDSHDVIQTYQDFCTAINYAAKKSNPLGLHKNYIPYWDGECETLYQDFLQFLDDGHSKRTAFQLNSTGVTKEAELDGQRRLRTLTSHTLAESIKHC